MHHLTGREFFPPLQGRQWYQTRGFKELALVHGVVEDSYRKTSALINRVRHQPAATPARRLGDTSAQEGQKILSYLEDRAAQVLAAHEVSAEGTPPEVLVSLSGRRADTLAAATVQAAIAQCDLAPELKGEMAANPSNSMKRPPARSMWRWTWWGQPTEGASPRSTTLPHGEESAYLYHYRPGEKR